jgi:phosphoglycerate dehydrogenase-like enzyme
LPDRRRFFGISFFYRTEMLADLIRFGRTEGISEMHVTIVGYGTIGRMQARILRGFGAKISIVDPRPPDHLVAADVWGAIDEIPERIRDATPGKVAA